VAEIHILFADGNNRAKFVTHKNTHANTHTHTDRYTDRHIYIFIYIYDMNLFFAKTLVDQK